MRGLEHAFVGDGANGLHHLYHREGERLTEGHRTKARTVVLAVRLHDAWHLARVVDARHLPDAEPVYALREILRADDILRDERSPSV